MSDGIYFRSTLMLSFFSSGLTPSHYTAIVTYFIPKNLGTGQAANF